MPSDIVVNPANNPANSTGGSINPAIDPTRVQLDASMRAAAAQRAAEGQGVLAAPPQTGQDTAAAGVGQAMEVQKTYK
jgi:hypothetical protein